MPKCILIVIDSLGVGEAPDAELYGDKGTNTFGNVSKANGGLELPTFEKLGFGAITEIEGLNNQILFKFIIEIREIQYREIRYCGDELNIESMI